MKAVRERGGNGPGGGRPWCLPPADRVLPVAVYYRTNLTMRRLAALFGISPATGCRVIHRLWPLLALEPTPWPVADVERLWIVDVNLARDRTVAASSRNYWFSANVQVTIDTDSRLVIASARPAPGNKADAHAGGESDLPAIAAGTTVIADGACLGAGLIAPSRTAEEPDAHSCEARRRTKPNTDASTRASSTPSPA
ncbi:DDE superfamily endonuclease [Streptomyces sp. KhCrAH-43]|nr:DDE superfamily endonuclease [Streptomyces sp. KhCrAH-43]